MKERSVIFIRLITLTVLLSWSQDVWSQDQRVADSLIIVLNSMKPNESGRLRILARIGATSTKPNDRMKYAELLLNEAISRDNAYYKARAYTLLANVHRMKGELEKSLEVFFEAAQIAEKNKLNRLLGEVYSDMATIYTSANDIDNALKYSTKSIDVLRQAGSTNSLALALLNIGYDYYMAEKYDTALIYYNESILILDSVGHRYGFTYAFGNRALVKWKIGLIDEAINELDQTIKMLGPMKDVLGMADYHIQLGNIFFEQNQLDSAVKKLTIGVIMANDNDLKEQARDGSRLLSEAYRDLGNADSAYHYLYQYLSLRDSVTNEEVAQALANMRADFEIGQKQDELDAMESQQRQRQMLIGVAIGLIVIAFIIIYRYQQYRAKKKLERQVVAQRIAELKALKAQINPHFLFNALNSIQSYILEEELTIAEEYLVKYGKLIRKILNHSNDLLISLNEELELLSLYVELEQIRIGGGFEYAVDIAESIDQYQTKIPSMAIQPFIENAIWHGVSSLGGRGKIDLKISATEEVIEVTIKDNGVGFDTNASQKTSSKGVNLVKERLELLKEMHKTDTAIELKSEPGMGTTATLRFSKDLE